MTREEAISNLKSLIEVRRKYGDMQTMKDEIECLDMGVKALTAISELSKSLKAVNRYEWNEKVLIGFNMAVAIFNECFGEICALKNEQPEQNVGMCQQNVGEMSEKTDGMTLDEAIIHAEEVAYQKDLESEFETDNERYAMTDIERANCKKCAEEHRQLAEWLKEFKQLREQTRWIPVSERLPEEENKRYWICTDCGYQCECRWTNVNHIWTYLTTDWHWNIMDVPQYSKVVAWMPLPEPYKAESEEQ